MEKISSNTETRSANIQSLSSAWKSREDNDLDINALLHSKFILQISTLIGISCGSCSYLLVMCIDFNFTCEERVGDVDLWTF